MKKLLLSLLTVVLLLVFTTCAMAEAAPVLDAQRSVPPINLPAVPEDMYTQWQLYTEEPALPVEIAIASSEGSYIVTLQNADMWGANIENGTVWQYDSEAQDWLLSDTLQAAQLGSVELHVPAEVYAANGLPVWYCASIDETYSIWIEDYSGDPAAPEFFLTLGNDNGIIAMPPEGLGFTYSSYGDASMTYCVYNAQGQLTLGTYMLQNDNDDFVSYAITPDETEGSEGYVLYYINVQTADGNNLLWTEGAWQDISGNEVAAPQGYSAEELPFELIEP